MATQQRSRGGRAPRRGTWIGAIALAAIAALLLGGTPSGGDERARVARAQDEVRLYLPAVLHGEAPETPNAFSLALVPGAITNSVPGQRCVFLVTMDEGEDGAGGPVALSVTTEAGSAEVTPETMLPGDVAEVWLVPDPGTPPRTIAFTVTGRRGTEVERAQGTLHVLDDMPGVDEERAVHAAVVRDRFAPWLAEAHPELGIDPETEWRGTIVTPQILVVMHYLFFSEEWEMHVAWHVMIPPHDWARIDLRHRFDETVPSRAFEISSWQNETEPIEIDPPEALWR